MSRQKVVVQVRGGVLEPIRIDDIIDLEVIDHDDGSRCTYWTSPETGEIKSEGKEYKFDE